MTKSSGNLKKRILLSLLVASNIIFGFFILLFFVATNKADSDFEKELNAIDVLFANTVKTEKNHLNAIIDTMLFRRYPEIEKAWQAKDREELLKLTSPLFARLKNQYQITHFYFHNPDKTNFLRVHKPDKYGDFIDRYTLMKAEKYQSSFSGIELGPLGALTLRAVQPWKINGNLVGYIELGSEIDLIIKKIINTFNVDIYLSLNKNFLDRKNWEEGNKMLNHVGNWDALPSSALINNKMEKIPEPLLNILRKENIEALSNKNTNLLINNEKFQIKSLPIYDALDRKIGNLIVLFKINEERNFYMSLLWIICPIFIADNLILLIMLAKNKEILKKEES